jgi:hypothetical protein
MQDYVELEGIGDFHPSTFRELKQKKKNNFTTCLVWSSDMT